MSTAMKSTLKIGINKSKLVDNKEKRTNQKQDFRRGPVFIILSRFSAFVSFTMLFSAYCTIDLLFLIFFRFFPDCQIPSFVRFSMA